MRVALKDGLLGILSSGKIPVAAKVNLLSKNTPENPSNVASSDVLGSRGQEHINSKI